MSLLRTGIVQSRILRFGSAGDLDIEQLPLKQIWLLPRSASRGVYHLVPMLLYPLRFYASFRWINPHHPRGINHHSPITRREPCGVP